MFIEAETGGARSARRKVNKMTMGKKLNEDKPWSEMDLYDLRDAVASGLPAREIADFMLRREDEITSKVSELQLGWPSEGSLIKPGVTLS